MCITPQCLYENGQDCRGKTVQASEKSRDRALVTSHLGKFFALYSFSEANEMNYECYVAVLSGVAFVQN